MMDDRMDRRVGPPGNASRPGGMGPGDSRRARRACTSRWSRRAVDQMEKRITSTLEEYVEIKEVSEVMETLKELPSKECFPFVNYKAVEMCCDGPKHKDCLVSVCALARCP